MEGGSKLKLYELTASYKNIWDLVDSDIDLDVLEDTLKCVEDAIEVKAENIGKLIKMMEADETAIKQEENRLADRRRAISNRRERIKSYIELQLTDAGIDKVKTPTLTVAMQNNPPAVDVFDQEAIPAKFLTIVPEQHIPDKKKIADALKAKEIVPGAKLIQGRSLRIR